MAWEIKTYLVISPTPVVVEDPAFAESTVYNPGDTFERRENNASVVKLLEEEKIVETVGEGDFAGFIQVPGPQGPTGPAGPVGTAPLSGVLAVGNVTGSNDIIITGGQAVTGGRIALGSSTTATLDGDLSAGSGSNDLSWTASTGALSATNGTSTLAWTPATETLAVTGSVNGAASISVENTSPGTDAYSEVAVSTGISGALLRMRAYGTNHSTVADTAVIESDAPATTLRIGTVNSAPIQIRTVDTHRWSFTTSGAFTAATDNAYDIGIAAMNRPRTLFLATGAHIGQTGGSTDVGDFRASDGVNELVWDASAGNLTIPNLIADTINPAEHTVLMQQVFS